MLPTVRRAAAILAAAGAFGASAQSQPAPDAIVPFDDGRPLRPPPAPTGIANERQTLTSIVFIPDDRDVDAAPRAPIDVSRVPLANDPALTGALRPLLGRPITESMLRYVTDEVRKSLQARGHSFAAVLVPKQEIRNGIVHLTLVQGRVGRITVDGTKHFAESQYLGQLRLAPGMALDRRILDEDVAWIGKSNPYRSAAVVASPGASVGETDIELRVQERSPWSFNAGFDNTGSLTTGTIRLQFGATWANAFGLGHQASYNLSASPDFDGSVSHSGSYALPLPWRHILTISGNYAEIHGRLAAPFDLRGKSSGWGLRYAVPLADRDTYTHGLSFGLDYKRSDNNLLFSSTPVNNTLTEVVNVVAAYNGSLPDDWGQTSFALNGTWSPGGLAGANNDARFGTSRAFASAEYTIAVLSVDRLTRLPSDLAWASTLRLQMASGNLLGSEQLGLGGTSAVRGYRDGTGYGDEGYVWRNELRLPALNPGLGGQHDQLSPFLFFDAAMGSRIDLLPGEDRRTTLSSLGVGARYGVGGSFSARWEAGRKMSSAAPGAPLGFFVHLGASFAF